MEEAERGRKKVLQTAISALCLEAGFISVEKKALDALGQLAECCKTKSLCFVLNNVFLFNALHTGFANT